MDFETVQWRDWLFRTREKDLKTRLCVGLVNVVLTPFILVALSIHIYLIPCIQAGISSICCSVLFGDGCLLSLFKGWMYTDSEFPPNKASLGAVKVQSEIKWKRARDITVSDKKSGKLDENGKKMSKVFEQGIDPTDIAQGQLGDCWLLSALAALAEQPETIQNCFLTDAYNPRGKYQFRLWDDISKKYVTISIDDYIPVSAQTGQPIFSNPKGNEMWVMLLEKAIAKLCGNYGNIEGGYPLFAMRAITGDEVNTFTFNKASDQWNRLDMKVLKGQAGPDIAFYHATEHSKFNSDAMYKVLVDYIRAGYILAAGTTGKDNTIAEGRGEKGGIVPGHAYSILDVYSPKLTVSDIKLVKLRNPWGSFEWQGDWSDNSDLWAKHPAIKLEMGFVSGVSKDDDGIFYMSWKDFLNYFDGVDVCCRSRDFDDIQLDLNEDWGICGPFLGCIFGCLKYWVCCCGLYHLWCARRSNQVNTLPR